MAEGRPLMTWPDAFGRAMISIVRTPAHLSLDLHPFCLPGFSRRRSLREKFLSTFFEIWKSLSTFFEIFGKFVNKNAIKSDFWGVVCRYISKISKKIPDFGQKVFLHRAKFWKYFSTGGVDPPPNPSGTYPYGLTINYYIFIFGHGRKSPFWPLNDLYRPYFRAFLRY